MEKRGQMVGYIRVSTVAQNTDRQLSGVEVDKVFTDKVSGKSTDRTELKRCIEYIREGDTLIVHSLDRLARNLKDLRNIMDELLAKGVEVKFVKEGWTFKPGGIDPTATLMLSIMGAIAEFERMLILERTKEGVALAKAAGKFKGRKPVMDEEKLEQAKRLIASGVPKAKVAKQFKIDRGSLYKYLREGVSRSDT